MKMSDDISLISMHPFFQRFVFSIIQTIKKRDFGVIERTIIDSDLVPRVSKNVMEASMGARTVVPKTEEPRPVTSVIDRDMSKLIAPIERFPSQKMRQSMEILQPTITRPLVIPKQVSSASIQTKQTVPTIKPKPVILPIMTNPIITAPVIASEGIVDEEQKYGKISPLLNDVSVSTIECPGEGKELMIIRAGQKQRTRVVLSAKDIKEILDKVADEAHIPLLEGIFRASVKGFSINAVISEMIGSKFVIKKATAYGLLE